LEKEEEKKGKEKRMFEHIQRIENFSAVVLQNFAKGFSTCSRSAPLEKPGLQLRMVLSQSEWQKERREEERREEEKRRGRERENDQPVDSGIYLKLFRRRGFR
jgi:hypothetical protein